MTLTYQMYFSGLQYFGFNPEGAIQKHIFYLLLLAQDNLLQTPSKITKSNIFIYIFPNHHLFLGL